MISHKHKCIFIHISKCAGSSIEQAFGIDLADITENNNPNLFGWNQNHQLFLQHATPQQLFDGNFIDQEIWDAYFKFIIVRNPFDRALSDYLWMMKDLKIKDSFENFLSMQEAFQKMKDKSKIVNYRADHLTKQRDYFLLNGKKIKYDLVLRFEDLKKDLRTLASHLKLEPTIFDKQVNVSTNNYPHYSYFYSKSKRKMVELKYGEDIRFLDYRFDDKRNLSFKIKCFLKGQL